MLFWPFQAALQHHNLWLSHHSFEKSLSYLLFGIDVQWLHGSFWATTKCSTMSQFLKKALFYLKKHYFSKGNKQGSDFANNLVFAL